MDCNTCKSNDGTTCTQGCPWYGEVDGLDNICENGEEREDEGSTVKKVLAGIGLTAWALGSIALLGIGIYGGLNQHTGHSCSLEVTTGHNLAVASDNVEIVVPVVEVTTPEVTVAPATDNVPCGSGCVRASFTVVSK